jgi:hypothetical protein
MVFILKWLLFYAKGVISFKFNIFGIGKIRAKVDSMH